MKLDYIILPTENVNETREWYSKYLDLGIEWESDDFVLMTGDNGARLGIHRGASLSESEQVHLHFEVADVNQPYDELRDAGLELSSPSGDTAWGYRTTVCHDPAGHSVEFFTPIHS